MKAKDLRIGNIVYYKVQDELDDRKEWNEVNVIDAEDILQLEASEINKWSHSYSPIPLTEKWLINFGFQSTEVWGDYANDKMVVRSDPKDDGVRLIDSKEYYFSDGSQRTYIKYVHQLQNLHFSLTEQELKYQPKKPKKHHG